MVPPHNTTAWKGLRWRALALLVGTVVLVVTLAGAQRTRAASASIAPLRERSCQTAQCHAQYQGLKVQHGPVELGMCLACHTIDEGSTPYEAGDDHLFDLADSDGHLCARCHESQEEDLHTHYPIELNRCLACHDPHGSDNPGMMRQETMADNCYECHEPEMDDDEFIHAPVRVGACTLCHDPHGSPNARSLVAPGPQLCTRCHVDMGERIASSRHAHRPVLEKCTACHAPHDAWYPFLLNDRAPTLCTGCHGEMGEHIANASNPHGALDNEQSCLFCHDPHAAEFSAQLKAAPIDLCLRCHGEELIGKDRVLRGMGEFLRLNPDHHGPVREGDCSACHNPHGSDQERILRKAYPPSFYAPFDLDLYSLCFSCHERSLVTDPQTETLTNYRNGTQNLHFVHVNREKKGRTCRTCHDVHASKHPKHIADSVPFGSWKLPIAFEKNPNGGSCSPGCHQPRSYDRRRPVNND